MCAASAPGATAPAASAPESKWYKAVHQMRITNVGSLVAQKKAVCSSTFTCPDDPLPTSFNMMVNFEETKCSVWIRVQSRDVWFKFIRH